MFATCLRFDYEGEKTVYLIALWPVRVQIYKRSHFVSCSRSKTNKQNHTHTHTHTHETSYLRKER